MIDTVPHIPERCWGAAGLVMFGEPELRSPKFDPSQFDLKNGPLQPSSGLRYSQATVKDLVTRKDVIVNLPLGDMKMTASIFQDPKPWTDFHWGIFFHSQWGADTVGAGGSQSLFQTR